MKIIKLCRSRKCPVIKITKEFVEIGEKRNICKLKINEWNSLKKKILNDKI